MLVKILLAPWASLFLFAASTVGCVLEAGDERGDVERTDVAEGELVTVHSLLPSCPDPGAMRYQGKIYVTCTGKGFPIYAADHPKGPYSLVGHVFPDAASRPPWANGDF